MAAARDERVGAVVADSPFASERALVRAILGRRLGPLHGSVAALTRRLLLLIPGR